MKQKDESLYSGKDEMNLVEFPITLLAKRHSSEGNTIEFTDTIQGEGGKLVKREWTVAGSEKFGLPLAQDNDVLLALLAMGKEKNFSSRKIYFSRYRLCKIMRWKIDGRAYKRIAEALDRMRWSGVKAQNAFWDNERKSYVTKAFGIIDEYELLDSSKPGPPGQDSFPFSYVILSEALFASIKAGYIKSLDMKTYFELESALAKRLYRYLDKKAYGKGRFEIGLFTLADVHLGLKLCKYSSQIKQQLEPAHNELIKVGFLKSTECRKTSDGSSEKVIYTFFDKAEMKEEMLVEADSQSMPCDSELLTRLVEIGITHKVAEQIVREYTAETVNEQMEMLPYRKAKDPAAALVAAIKDSWAPPASYKTKVKSEQKKEAGKLEQTLEEKQKAGLRARIEEYLAKLSPAECEALKAEAGELARQEGAKIFRNKEVPQYVLDGYVHIVVEQRLGLQGGKNTISSSVTA